MKLRVEYRPIYDDLIETLKERGFPESVSDLQWAVESIIRKYDMRLRPTPLDRDEVRMPNNCPVCRRQNDGSVKLIGRDSVGEEIHCHMGCIFFANEVGK